MILYEETYFFIRFRARTIIPSKPAPSSTIVLGSGTGDGAGIANAVGVVKTIVNTVIHTLTITFFINNILRLLVLKVIVNPL
jgi:hypothetical protein